MESVKNSAQFKRIFSECDEWQGLANQSTEKQLDVYVDLKSPHAYLAVRPTLEIARDYAVRVNFLPYTLSYAGVGLTTSVEPDMQRRPPSAAADRKARMYYTAAREYAALQGLPFRTPYRLLDSELAHRAFLYAKLQNLEVPFAMLVYMQGWGSGWREYELESAAELRNTLIEIGANMDGFEAFIAANGPGQRTLDQCMADAETSGYAGVPHYVMFDERSKRQLGLFGREHLALIRQKFGAQGLARNDEVVSEFSHTWASHSDSTSS